MSETTKIQFAHHTWSPWRGCEHAGLPDGTEHPGCDHCYAEAMAKRNPKILGKWGDDGVRVVAAEKSWDQVRRWNDSAKRRGAKESVFPSMCDPFEEWGGQMTDVNANALYSLGDVPPWQPHESINRRAFPGFRPDVPTFQTRMDDVRRQLFWLIDECENLDWLLLTKRPGNIKRMCKRMWTGGFHKNAWLHYSASDQKSLEAGVPDLLKCRHLSPVLGLSLEPLTGPISFRWAKWDPWYKLDPNRESVSHLDGLKMLNWVIVGGESGPGARPCNVQWIRSIVSQCREAGVPVFVKQMGANVITRNDQIEDVFSNGRSGWPDPEVEHDIHGFCENYQGADCRIILRDKKGGDWDEWPEDLRVRQMPEVVG